MSDFNPKVSFYPSATQPVPISDPDFTEVIGWIKSRRYRGDVEAVRARFKYLIDRGATQKEAKTHTDKVKQRLCAFNASGVFVFRKEERMKSHSGLIQADFDLLGDRLTEIREKLALDVYVYALFTSPTGEGLKAFYRCPPVPAELAHPANKIQHERCFAAVEKHCLTHYGVQIDESVKDMSRLCFVSDDPDAQIFPDAEEIEPIDPPELVASTAKPVQATKSTTAFRENRENDPELVRSALKAIPADERSVWLKIGAGLKGSFGESGWSIFDEWSKTSEKYDAEGNRRVWDSLETVSCTVGSVFHAAKSWGWVFPRKERSDNGHQSQSRSEYMPQESDVPQADDYFDSLAPVETSTEPVQATNKESERISAVLQSRQFNFASPPPKAPVRYWLSEIGICTAGNLTAISAGVKSGKTSAVMAMISSAMCQDRDGRDFLGFSSSNPQGHALIHIDTEQSQEDHDEMVRRSLKRAGLVSPPEWFLSFCLTGLSVRDLQLALKTSMQTAFGVFRGIHSVVLDGSADFVADVNEPEACNAFVAYLHSEAILYKCPIIGIIHFNPGTEKTRGHLGSQLERKSETNLRLEKEESTDSIVMWSDKNRRAPILKRTAPRFQWSDDAGMHVSVDLRPAEATVGGRTSVVGKIATMNSHEFIQGCLPDGETLRAISRRLEIWLASQRLDVSPKTCERAVPELVANGKLMKEKDLLYRRGPNA